jgi:hypothetical protein
MARNVETLEKAESCLHKPFAGRMDQG